ncbi:kinase-like protein, partial [Rozella allomycis CSF55]
MHDFDLLRRLGSGTFGTVYKAKRMSDESIFALKYMHNRIMTGEDLKYALHVEVRALDLLSFSNFFPKLVCMNKDESIRELFYVMEIVDGVALDQYVETSRPTFKQMKLIFAKTLLALEDL